ncbi:MAG: dockerin type I domain-containing protein [Candidatus Latescibacterota bacterium]
MLRLARRESSDFNGDASVDLSDFFTLVDAFGSSPTENRWNDSADLNGDGLVDFDDFFVFIDSFNRSNTPNK